MPINYEDRVLKTYDPNNRNIPEFDSFGSFTPKSQDRYDNDNVFNVGNANVGQKRAFQGNTRAFDDYYSNREIYDATIPTRIAQFDKGPSQNLNRLLQNELAYNPNVDYRDWQKIQADVINKQPEFDAFRNQSLAQNPVGQQQQREQPLPGVNNPATSLDLLNNPFGSVVETRQPQQQAPNSFGGDKQGPYFSPEQEAAASVERYRRLGISPTFAEGSLADIYQRGGGKGGLGFGANSPAGGFRDLGGGYRIGNYGIRDPNAPPISGGIIGPNGERVTVEQYEEAIGRRNQSPGNQGLMQILSGRSAPRATRTGGNTNQGLMQLLLGLRRR